MSNPILVTTNGKLDIRVKEPSGIGAQVPLSGPGSSDRFNINDFCKVAISYLNTKLLKRLTISNNYLSTH